MDTRHLANEKLKNSLCAGIFYVYEEEGFPIPLLKFISTLSDAAEVSMMYSINMSL